MSQELTCKRCHSTKSENEFSKNKDGKYLQRCNYCREQHNFAMRKYMQEQSKIRKDEKEKYNALHWEEIEKKKAEHREVMRDKHREKCRKWRENNIAKKKEDNKEYYENNKEKLNEQHMCECGKSYTLHNKIRHQMSNKHQAYLESQSIQ